MSAESSLHRGIISENPVGMLLLGLCPAAAVSVRVIDALWMSAGVMAVLLLARLCMSLITRTAVEGSDPPALNGQWLGALVIASCLTACFEIVLLAAAPAASATLGIYAPLIAVNCLVLGREGTARRGSSLLKECVDALGQGLGFTACLVLIAVVRESLGAGTLTLFPMGSFNGILSVPFLSRDPARALGAAGGGLLCLGYLAAAARLLSRRRRGDGEAAKDGRI
jgi:Na+-translocating ferredoxin:NAD+ oxidoreductase subunit E